MLLGSSKIVHSQRVATPIKWAKSHYYMIKLLTSVTQFGQIWKRLNKITLQILQCVLGYKVFELQ